MAIVMYHFFAVTVSFEKQTSLVNEDVGSLEVNVTLRTANFSSPVFVSVATFEIPGSAKGVAIEWAVSNRWTGLLDWTGL